MGTAIEEEVRRHGSAGDWDAATEATLRGHGREVLELLLALHRDPVAASDVFAIFSEGVWRGLRTFEWSCALRTWLYAVARRSSLRYRRDGRRRASRERALPDESSASVLVAQLRSQTASFLRTEARSRIAALRDALPDADQTLLMLRVDRGLEWAELAVVFHEVEGKDASDDEDDEKRALSASPEALKRETARLRKRFQLIKEKLHEMARREGLVRGDSS